MKGKMKKRKVLIIVIVIVLVVVGVATAIVMKNKKSQQKAKGTMTQKQSTISLGKMDLTTSISATGTIQSERSKMVSADVNGVEVTSVKVSVGDEVKKGDVLVTFDESDLQESLSDAKENLSDAEDEAARNLSSAKEQLSDAKETYRDEKEKLAEDISDAKEELTFVKKQVTTLKKQISAEKNTSEKTKLEEQLTKAEESAKQAENAYETAVSNRENTNKQNKKNIENAEDAVESAESNKKKSMKEAQKQVEEAEETLAKCSVTASMDGIITASNISEGDTYNGGDMFQIDNVGTYVVSTSVDEYDISNVSKGQRVVILTEATGDDEIEGEITFVAPSTGSTSLSSGSSQGESMSMSSSSSSGSGYEVKIQVKTADERLRMGLTARCSIILQEVADVYAVPYDAVHENTDGTTVVYVSETSGESTTSREVIVTKGMESDYYVEISGDELTDGMQIILPTDEVSASSSEETKENGFNMFGGGAMPGGNGGSMLGGASRGNRGSGGMGGGMPGM